MTLFRPSWPSWKREWQKVLKADPPVRPPRLTAPLEPPTGIQREAAKVSGEIRELERMVKVK